MSNPPPPPPAPDQDPQTPPAAPAGPTAPGQPYSAPAAPGYGAPQQTYGQQPGYGQQQTYGQPAAYAGGAYSAVAAPRTNPLAIAALIAACGGVIIWVLAPIAGAIMGHIALGQIKRTGENGRGMALAGVLVGWILGGLQLLGIIAYIIFIVVVVAAGAGASSGYGDF